MLDIMALFKPAKKTRKTSISCCCLFVHKKFFQGFLKHVIKRLQDANLLRQGYLLSYELV